MSLLKLRYQSIILMAIILSGTISAQSLYPGQFQDKIKVKTVPVKVESFELKDVRLLPSRLKENQDRDSAWMANIAIDRLLHSFFNNAGVWAGLEGGYMTVKKYGGWESLDCELRGHTTGHLLSAYALMYNSTRDSIFRQKSDSIVAGLKLVQEKLGEGYLSAFPEELINRNIRGERVWAPWYTQHKILSGLIDQYLYLNNEEALRIAKNMGDWAYIKLKDIDEPTRQKMLRNEFGGINEAFYNLYSITGNDKYKWLGDFFYHNEVIDPLKDKDNDFGTKHTNTFIPKVLGEIRNYEIVGNKESLDLSEFFWDEMGKHQFVTGSLSDKEHFFPLDKFTDHISGYTGETCVTYNMLKLGKHLFSHNPDSKIFDYYEKALYNHILGQQNPETGMVTYFLPLKSGTHKVYSTPENSFWCCVGSGFENHAKYAESIYFHDSDNESLYVNLFIPSKLNWQNKGIEIIQENSFPYNPSTSLKVKTDKKTPAKIKIRKPSWTKNFEVKVNGQKYSYKTDDKNYAVIDRNWKDGDKIDVNFEMSLELIEVPGNERMAALTYGPIVLAGRLGTEGMESPAPNSNPALYNDYYTYDYHIPENLPTFLDLESIENIGELTWKNSNGVIIQPFFDIHNERYIVYWDIH